MEFIYEHREYDLKTFSCSKWVANEIIKRLEENKSDPPLVTIEYFRYEMINYSLMNEHAFDIFSLAYSVAEDIIDIIVTQ